MSLRNLAGVLAVAVIGLSGCASSGTDSADASSAPSTGATPVAQPSVGGSSPSGASATPSPTTTPTPSPSTAATPTPSPAAPATPAPVPEPSPATVPTPPAVPSASTPSTTGTGLTPEPVAGTTSTAQCVTRDISAAANGDPEGRPQFAFPTILGADPGVDVVSACIQVVGVGALGSVSLANGDISVNDGAFRQGAASIASGDRVRLRLRAATAYDNEVSTSVSFGGVELASFSVRTRNDDRAPTTFRVGPSRTYSSLSAVAPLLRAGDLVEVDGGITYSPVEFTRSGSPDKPITIRGIAVSGRRPVVSGGTNTVHFSESHHMVFENFEVQGGSQICVRSMANGVVVRNVFVHDCARHGILGTDLYSGTLVLDRVEVARAGGQPSGENTKHPVYVATDRDRFPGSVLRVQFSYIHDFGGGGVKSRSERNEIYYNWIDVKDEPNTLYTLELYGYEEYATISPIHSDVVGNVLVHRGARGVRLGGDGTGASRGRVRFFQNTFVLSSKFANRASPLVRLFQSIDSVQMINNLVVFAGSSQTPVWLFRDDIPASDWVTGQPRTAGANNWLPSGTAVSVGSPAAWTGTLAGASNPGLTSIGSMNELDLRPDSGSALRGSGSSSTSIAGFDVPSPLTVLSARAPFSAPASGQDLSAAAREAGTGVNVGAH